MESAELSTAYAEDSLAAVAAVITITAAAHTAIEAAAVIVRTKTVAVVTHDVLNPV